MRANNDNRINNKGFTLIELIVVLLILAILAAILVPMLLGYIEEARDKQYIINAKGCLNAAQAELTKLYAKEGGSIPEGNTAKNCVIDQVVKKNKNEYKYSALNGDANITNSIFAKSVLEKAGVNPYVLVIGVGSNLLHNDVEGDWEVTLHDKYTVYYVFYIEKEGATPCFYYNGEWTRKYPRYNDTSDIFSKYNVIQVGSLKGKRLQYYCLVNDSGYTFHESGFWGWARKFK